jgi:hypothetical protein
MDLSESAANRRSSPGQAPDANATPQRERRTGAIKNAPTCSGKVSPKVIVVAKPIASTMTRPRTNRDGERRCRIDTLGVMVVPMAAITENTVMNERTLTSHSGMISTTASRA